MVRLFAQVELGQLSCHFWGSENSILFSYLALS